MNLNEQQYEAVTHYGSPQIIIAGAGTGKTTVIIEKIKHLISTNNHRPEEILALTFTNKAANEMKTRFSNTNPTPSGGSPMFGTFHSFCLRLLKQSPYLTAMGIPTTFSIIDGQQQKDIIGALSKKIQMSIERKPKDILSKISKVKQLPEHLHPEALSMAPSDIQSMFHPYNAALREKNCVDFDDLLLLTHRLLIQNQTALHDLQQKYTYVIVDEYQDTNHIQNELTLLLAGGHGNVCVVGDFDQTIYSWRGANVENLLSFNNHFPNCTTQKLEMNYRSTKEILDCANQIISFNTNRQPKRLIAQRTGHQMPEHIVCFNEDEEAATIAKKIKLMMTDSDYKWGDFAVLYRTNQQSRAIEEAFNRMQIPYQLLGGTSFYQRLEVKHAIAYLQCLHDTNQPIWFERAMLFPPRGVGKTSLHQLFDFCSQKNASIEAAIQHPECPLKPHILSHVQQFMAKLNDLRASETPIEKKLSELMAFLNFDDYLTRQDQAKDRMDNIKEFLSRCQGATDLGAFLDELALFQGNDAESNNESVRCLTLHLSKGLEFPVVFIPGFENDIMPLKNCEPIEEERRLAYVGITRGKHHVCLLSAYKRTLMGNDWYHDPSPFTKELNTRIDVKITEHAHLMGKAIMFKLEQAQIKVRQIKSQTPSIEKAPPSTFFQAGDIVFHPTLGTGTIESASGSGDALMYDIHFSIGKKKLMAKFAPLKKTNHV